MAYQLFTDLDDVRTFVVVVQAGTLTAAAKQLNVPTSTVSRSLTRLESRLGVLLLKRGSRGVALTDGGQEYLPFCKRAFRTLKDGSDLLERHRVAPSGLIKVACPITMAREIFAPLLKDFGIRYPDLTVELEPYASAWDQEPAEDVDVFFKVKAPKDSLRRVRAYPATMRGLFATSAYVADNGLLASPDEMERHQCIGSGPWKLTHGKRQVVLHPRFRVVTSDPEVHFKLVLEGAGIAILPLYLAQRVKASHALIPVLPLWQPEPIILCALFSGPSRLTPKIQALLDFLSEHIGTDRDPRLRGAKGTSFFSDPSLAVTSGP